VTLEQAQRVGQAYLTQANRTQGQYIPTDKPVRAPLMAIPNLQKDLAGYIGNVQLKQAEAFDPDPANIDALTQRKTLKVPNGSVKLAMLPKEARGDRVNATIALQFGSVEALKGQRLNAIVTADLLFKGTSTLTREQIDDRIVALGGEIGISGSGTNLTINLSTTHANIDALVALAFDVVQNANFAQEQLDEYATKLTTSLKSSMTEPTEIASRMLSRHGNPWGKDDIRYTPSFEESLAAVTSLKRSDLLNFHQTFYGASKVSIGIVGHFNPTSFEQTVAKSLSTWGAGTPYTRISNPYREVKPEQMQALTPDKANAFYTANLALKLQDTDPDYPALYLANFLLGSSETSRLWMRVREKEGLSYNVRSRLSVSPFEPSASWGVYAIFAPENRTKVQDAIRQELDRLVKDGFEATEVKDGIIALTNYRKLSRAHQGSLASAWVSYLETERSFAWVADLDKKIAALTPEQLNAAIRKYLQPTQFSSVAAGDFEKKK
jgi:zinc protease